MRLLRRHYGKLAAALLLAVALYVLWWALPVRPRAALLLPKGTGPVGLSPDGGYYLTNSGPAGLSADGRYFLTHSGKKDFGAVDGTNGFRSRCDLIGPLRLWDTSNGQLAATVSEIGGSLRGVEIAPNGRSLALVVGENPVFLRVIESFTGR